MSPYLFVCFHFLGLSHTSWGAVNNSRSSQKFSTEERTPTTPVWRFSFLQVRVEHSHWSVSLRYCALIG